MPRVDFSDLPDGARVWVFASDRPLGKDEAHVLLEEVDAFLDQWKAHGTPLRNARDWREHQFLAIGVDPTAEQASGCSIDALFRALQQLGSRLATNLVAGGRVFYRDRTGTPRLALRQELPVFVRAGEIGQQTPVFDTTLTRAGDYRRRFEQPARDTWLASLIPQTA